MFTLRNIIGVFIGFLISMIIIISSIKSNSEWIQYENTYSFLLPFQKWEHFIKSASFWFFISLLTSFGIASLIGSIITAIIVKKFKKTYSVILGFILYIIELMDRYFNFEHPNWYNTIIPFILFPLCWLGGKIVEHILLKVKKKK